MQSRAQTQTTHDWRCPSCGKSGSLQTSIVTHGPNLLFAVEQSHKKESPDCDHTHFVLAPVGPRPREEWPAFLNYLMIETQRIEEAAKSKILEPTLLMVVKDGILWLDCQLSTDGESVAIAKEIEKLRERIEAAEALAAEAGYRQRRLHIFARW